MINLKEKNGKNFIHAINLSHAADREKFVLNLKEVIA